MVVFGCDEDLTLSREAAPRARVLDAVEVALEAQPVRVGLLGSQPLPRADRTRRSGREFLGEASLPLLPPEEDGADVRVDALVRSAHHHVFHDDRLHGPQHFTHTATVPTGCDSDRSPYWRTPADDYAVVAGPPAPNAAWAAARRAIGTRYGEHDT